MTYFFAQKLSHIDVKKPPSLHASTPIFYTLKKPLRYNPVWEAIAIAGKKKKKARVELNFARL